MKIGIIGSGKVGGNLGINWAKAGHDVYFSSRHPQQLTQLRNQAGKNASAVSVVEAARYADVVLLATPFWATPNLADKLAPALKGKVIIDATNPYPDRDGKMAEQVRRSNYTASEFTAHHFPDSEVTKAFNTIKFDHLKERAFKESDKLAVPYSASTDHGKEVTQQLIQDIGFDDVFVGPITKSKPMDVDQSLYAKSLNKAELERLLPH